MADKHKEWLVDGERVYIGKIDSLKVFSGDERVRLRFWASDPRAKSVRFYWVPENDSVIYPLTHTAATDSFELELGRGTEKPIGEGNYTLLVTAIDNNGHYSLPFEKMMNVYGDRFRASLTNRAINSMTYAAGVLTLNFSGPVNDRELGIELFFTDNSDVQHATRLTLADLETPVFELADFNPAKGLSYRTFFLPVPQAIDTFVTATAAVPIEINVALNKPVTFSDQLNASFPGTNAVDGNYADASRWVSTASGTHWLEVDLGAEYAVERVRITNGASGNYSNNAYVLAAFTIQAWQNGAWVEALSESDNKVSDYKKTLDTPVTTSKLRFETTTQTRIFEFEAYTTIR
jgi:hypothetical protein